MCKDVKAGDGVHVASVYPAGITRVVFMESAIAGLVRAGVVFEG